MANVVDTSWMPSGMASYFQQQQAPNSNPSTQFQTPGQIASQRSYANALLNQTIPTGTSGNVTAVSPWGGLAHMTGAGLGALMMRNAGQQEKGSMMAGANASPYWNNQSQGLNMNALFGQIPGGGATGTG